MVLAKPAGTNPRALAEAIKPKLEALPPVTSVDVAGPGFINLRLTPDVWRDELRTILREGERYGLSTIGANERVNVEYVSANPTGPLHMGHCRGAVAEAMEVLRSKGLVYEGTLERPKSLDEHDEWEPVELTLFRSTQFGDDQDRPMKKSDGSWTYFGSDAAYHWRKAQNADHLVNIWGADHAGTIKRVQAAVKALTDGRVDLDVKLINMVRLFRAGEPVKMSKRAGDFVTLADVVEEVGKDVVRFMMLTKRADTPLDFDFAKVVEASKDNPVFYVQYAHARISSLKRKAADAGVDLAGEADLALLDDEELALVKRAAQYSRVIEGAAMAHEPHRIAFYLYDLAAEFHALWNRGNDDPERRFLVENNPQLSRSRLELALGIAQIIRSGLDLMGVAATEEMR